MRSRLLVSYVHKFLLGKDRLGEPTIRDQERLYAAWVDGEEMVLRYRSGHGTHKQHPHTESQCPSTNGAQPLRRFSGDACTTHEVHGAISFSVGKYERYRAASRVSNGAPRTAACAPT